MIDLLLIFPPQWSPFQPPLSLPSLSAWLKRSGFKVGSIDLNILFYDWLLSDECAAFLIEQLEGGHWPEALRYTYITTFRNAVDFREDLHRLRLLRRVDGCSDSADYCKRHYLAIKSIESYLRIVSHASQNLVISPYGFHLPPGKFEAGNFERMVYHPPAIIELFLRHAILSRALPSQPRLFGLSCIGQEQLYFTVLLGRLLKEVSGAPIVVGGTILPRLLDCGALRNQWFGQFFDVLVRNEGEKPCEQLLSNLLTGKPLTQGVPSIHYVDHRGLQASAPCSAIIPRELPIPDFDDLPLERYLAAEITLPLLSSRECYWGKCEFCHRGLVQSQKYLPYGIDGVLSTVEQLARRYNVRRFAFYDDAIPPRTVRAMGKFFPPHTESGWCFTGLAKFEPYFQRQDFDNLYRIGFRALYVGLESASERVLALMKKNSSRATMVKNLRDAHAAGIWMHCYLFFGFPGETDDDAKKTYDFILSHSDIIGSFGCGVFSLELGSPMANHIQDFGVSILPSDSGELLIYRDYCVTVGIARNNATDWMQRLNKAAYKISKYRDPAWIPDEHLMIMLSFMTPESLVAHSISVQGVRGLPMDAPLAEVFSYLECPLKKGSTVFLNRLNGRAALLDGAPAQFIRRLHQSGACVGSCMTHLSAFLGEWVLRVNADPAKMEPNL